VCKLQQREKAHLQLGGCLALLAGVDVVHNVRLIRQVHAVRLLLALGRAILHACTHQDALLLKLGSDLLPGLLPDKETRESLLPEARAASIASAAPVVRLSSTEGWSFRDIRRGIVFAAVLEGGSGSLSAALAPSCACQR
jgi:hypothetical protein